jgi:hypothetical protein
MIHVAFVLKAPLAGPSPGELHFSEDFETNVHAIGRACQIGQQLNEAIQTELQIIHDEAPSRRRKKFFSKSLISRSGSFSIPLDSLWERVDD